jgi:head-tail adaptor
VTLGAYRHTVTVEVPGPMVPDGDGGYTESWLPGDPALWDVSIDPASRSDLELAAAGTVLSTALHSVRGRYHAGITTKARLLFEGRTLNIITVRNPAELNRTLELVCAEVVD